MKALRYFSMVIALTLCLGSVANAVSEIEVPITEFAIIAPPGNPHDLTVLISAPIPESLTTKAILHAEIICNVNPVVESDSSIEIAVFPIAVSWDPNETVWENSWEEMGGNLIDSLMTLHGIYTPGGGLSNLDVTDIIRRWIDGSYANNGIAIKPPIDLDSRFRVIPRNERDGVLASIRIIFIE